MSRARTVVVEDQVAAYWNDRADASSFELGLLVGQLSASNKNDAVLSAVSVPSELESGEQLAGLADVSVDWVQEVAQQVDRLLPGGIVVLGLYVVSSADVLQQATPYLRAAAEALALPSSVRVAEDVHYLALISPTATTFTAFTSIADVTKTQIVPAELKNASSALKFKQYRTSVVLDEPVPFVTVAPAKNLVDAAEQRTDELETKLKPLIRRVESALAVLTRSGSADVQHIKLLTSVSSPSPQDIDNSQLGAVRGSISCVAFVSQSEAEANEVAVNCLKRDFVKSLLLRVTLAREKWAEDDEAEVNAVFLEGGLVRLAQRGMIPWRSAVSTSKHFNATAHVFPDEDPAVAVQNALEVLGCGGAGDATEFVAMESSTDMTADEKASQQEFGYVRPRYELIFLLIPIALALLMLFIQQGFRVQEAMGPSYDW